MIMGSLPLKFQFSLQLLERQYLIRFIIIWDDFPIQYDRLYQTHLQQALYIPMQILVFLVLILKATAEQRELSFLIVNLYPFTIIFLLNDSLASVIFKELFD